jgi:O-antigen/teichoic acid export membrane protein
LTEIPSIAPERNVLSRLAGDSGALLLANAVFLVLGILRTKLATVTLGPEGLGVVAQLTQLSSVLVFLAALGLGTGARVALSRSGLLEQERAQAGKAVVLLTLGVAVVAMTVAMLLASPLSGAFLSNRDLTSEIRIGLLAVPFNTLTQLLMPVAQAWGDFKRIAIAAIATAILGSAVTVPLLLSHRLILAVATIPASAVIQLGCVVWASPGIRRTLLARPGMKRGLLREIVTVGGLSFVLGGVSALLEILVRAILVHAGGLRLVAGYQPINLLSTSGFGLVASAVGTALLVHVAREADSIPRAAMSKSLNDVVQTTILIVGGIGFAVQIGVRIYIPLLFSTDLLASARPVAYHMPVEVITAAVWILGSALLPLSLRRHWLLAGLVTASVETLLMTTTVGSIGLYAVPLGSAGGWLAGLLVTLHGLSRKGIHLSSRAIAMIVWTLGILTVGAVATHPNPAYSLAGVPIGLAAVWAIPVGIALLHRRKSLSTVPR